MANLVTLSRLPLLFIVILLIYSQSLYTKIWAFPLIVILFLMDWIDGLVARKNNEVSELGSILDIAIDRVVEASLWIVFADVDMVPVWAPLLVITRGFIVDAVRGYALSKGEAPFEMMHSKVGRILVSSRFSRGLYGFAKVFVFCLLPLSLVVTPLLEGSNYAILRGYLAGFIYGNVVFVVVFCLMRGLPVIWESKRFFRLYPKRRKQICGG